MHVIRKNEFQMVVDVSVAFYILAESIAVFELQFLCFWVDDSRCNG